MGKVVKIVVVALVVLASAFGGFVAQRSLTPARAAGPAAIGYDPVAPSRILDTRPPSAVGYSGPKPRAGSELVVAGIGGAVAVAVNITLTETEGAGFVTAWNGTAPRPSTSIINSTTANENIANFAIVPVLADGSFHLYTNASTHLVVDLMGYVPAPLPNEVQAQITGYGPIGATTNISGNVFNGTSVVRDVRIDIRCVDGSVQTDPVIALGPLQTKGFAVVCADGAYSSGASVQAIVDL
jgi:hypothetical protein